ncbi:MAG TPA: ABC transporter substrate-binding protein [Xanthobacteraceae bacterium]|nr:ABC transporter substrate-binding protein [Xanthobacteraceae bacterium]
MMQRSAQRLKGIVALSLLTLACLAGAPSRAAAQDLEPVSVVVFPGGFNWPIWVAQEKGYFAKGGIEVRLTPTPNSVFQLTGLIEGKFDIGLTAFDNVIAYMEGQGEASLSIQPDLFVFMGGDNGLLSLAVVPEIKTYQDLKDKTLSVDAMTTGYAFVLFDLLKRNGLKTGDYNVVKAGGVLERWERLRERKHDGTMLIAPFDMVAKANGFNILQYALDVYGQYQGISGAARRSWAAANPKKLEAYIRGYREGLAWLFEPQNKDEAIAIFRRNLPQLSEGLANQSYSVLVNPRGFAPDGALSIEGVRRVLVLRSEYGEPKKMLTDPMLYYDPRYYEAAKR